MHSPSVQQFLVPCTPEVRALVLRLRQVVLDVCPQAVEQPYPAWQIVRYALEACREERVCYIALLDAASVSLGFDRSDGLPDPDKRLTGTGARMRHVTIRPGDAFDEPYYRALLEAAFAGARQRASRRE
jgi:hypothetical protein